MEHHGKSWNELMSCGQELPRLQVLLGEVMTLAVACGDGGLCIFFLLGPRSGRKL